MHVNRIEHISIAVKNLDESIKFYEHIFGLKCYLIEEVEDQKVRTAFIKVGETKIELLETTDPNGTIGKFIENHGEGIHHIAFAVDDVDSSLNEMESKGIKLIDKKPRQGSEGFHIAFLNPKSTFGVLTELCEKKSKGK
ncbi:MAG: methylmalonyl-CoA epimerase [Ignavibacteriaceae bacterium]